MSPGKGAEKVEIDIFIPLRKTPAFHLLGSETFAGLQQDVFTHSLYAFIQMDSSTSLVRSLLFQIQWLFFYIFVLSSGYSSFT